MIDTWGQWNHPTQPANVSHYAFALAADRGRRMAAEALRLDPVARRRCEIAFGLADCKSRWPEAYEGPVKRFFRGLKS